MANEIQVRISLSLTKGNLSYRPAASYYTADVANLGGPTPGTISVAIHGTEVDLSALTTPGLCFIQNLDDTNYVTVGVYDGARFYPVIELLPGEFTVFRLSRNLNEEYVGTGTGTNSDINQLRLVANTAACKVLVQAFEA